VPAKINPPNNTQGRLAMTAILLASARVAADPPQEGKPAPAVKLPATQINKVLPDAKDAKELDLAAFKGKRTSCYSFSHSLATLFRSGSGNLPSLTKNARAS
jgi:hypothetical protein